VIVEEGSLYPALYRMERRGWLASRRYFRSSNGYSRAARCAMSCWTSSVLNQQIHREYALAEVAFVGFAGSAAPSK